MSYLGDLRKKPKHVRDNIAFVAAAAATLPVVAYLVFAVHGPKITNIAETDTNQPKFFETFTTQIKDQVAAVKEATSTTSPKYPSTVERGPLDAVPVEGNGVAAPAVLIGTTSSSSSPTSTPIAR